MFLSNLKNISINARKKNIQNIKKYSNELKSYIEILQNGGSSNGIDTFIRLLESEVKPFLNKLQNLNKSDDELVKLKQSLTVLKSILETIFNELNSLDDSALKELENLPSIIQNMNDIINKRLQTL
jgi:DNA repair ATPase RecN